MAQARIRTITGSKAARPGLGGNGAKDTEPIGKEDARSAEDRARMSDINAAYAKDIASLKTEIAVLKDRFDYT